MTNIHTRRILCLLTALALVVSLLSGLALTSFADTLIGSPTGYSSASQVVYDNSGSYLKNWGTRGETASFLTSYAQSYYTGSYSYASLSANSGSSSSSGYSSSALYNALHAMLTAKQTSTTSYNGTREMYCYTDCVNNNSSYISSFYSGTRLNGAWDSGQTWNREHTWPQSKTEDDSSQLSDIMMLRPTAVTENSGRGNKAYGESDGYYHPNSEAGATGLDLRGDCARIMLYCYVRWSENAPNMWGTDGVMESVDVLLNWMQQDPVDTWEMGRNDVVQSITGARNCFVDYPELAFLLFGRSIPAGMSTPSNGQGGSAPATVTLTYMANGAVYGTAATTAGQTVYLPATAAAVEGWTFSGWVTAELAETTATPSFIVPGGGFTPTADTTLYALYTKSEGGSGSGVWTKMSAVSQLTSGVQVVLACASKGVTAGSISNSVMVSTSSTFSADGQTISTLSSDAVILTLGGSSGAWTFANENGQLLGATAVKKLAWGSGVTTWSISISGGDATIQSTTSSYGRFLYNNGSPRFTTYTSNTSSSMLLPQLYYLDGSLGTVTYTTSPAGQSQSYTVSFSVLGDTSVIAPMTINSVTGAQLPAAEAPEGYSFLGWVTEDYDHVTVRPAPILTGLYRPQADITLKALYTFDDVTPPTLTQMGLSDTFSDGDKIVIVESGGQFALYRQSHSWNHVKSYEFTDDAASILADAKKYFPVKQTTNGWYLGDNTDGWLYTSANQTNLSIKADDSNLMSAFALTTYNGYLAIQDTVEYNPSIFYLSCKTDLSGTNQNQWAMVNASSISGTVTLNIYKLNEGGSVVTRYTTVVELPHTHTPAEPVIENEIPAACTTAGSYDSVVYCSECGEELSRETVAVPALGHAYGEWAVTTAPSCTVEGEETRACSRCDAVETRPVAMIDHSYEAVVIAPTCTEGGKTVYTCAVCGDSYEADLTDALGHNPGEPVQENYVEPTPTTEGGFDSVIYCQRCGAELERTHTTLDPTGPTEPIEIDTIRIYPSIGIGIETVASFSVRSTDLSSYESWYIEVSKLDGEGNAVESKRFGDGQEGSVSGSFVYKADYTDITAKELGVPFTASVHAFDANGQEYVSHNIVSNSPVFTVRDYILGELVNEDNADATRKLAADLLNYGAAAQVYFGFDTENLVNENLSAEAQAAMNTFATTGEAPAVLVNNANSANIFSSVSVMNRIMLTLSVRGFSDAGAVQIEIKNHETGAVKEVIDAEKVNTIWRAKYSGFEAEDMRTAFDFTVIANGAASGTPITWSVEGYAREARLNEDSSPEELALLNALLHYVDAVAAVDFGN